VSDESSQYAWPVHANGEASLHGYCMDVERLVTAMPDEIVLR